MAWMNQEKKAAISAELKKVMPKSWKYSLSVRNHSTLVLTIRSAPIDLTKGQPNINVNHYWLDKQFSGDLLVQFVKIRNAMNTGNWDHSDAMTDYFDVGHYVDIKVGDWDKPFKVM
jgi:hypothetical protein